MEIGTLQINNLGEVKGNLPYRALTDDERNDLRFKINGLVVPNHGHKYVDKNIWESTRDEGLKMVDRIRNFGYDVSEPFGWVNETDGYGEACKIYVNSRVEAGRVALWEVPGFFSEPVSVDIPKYDPAVKDALEDIRGAFNLADRLKREKINFELSPSFRDLNIRLGELTREQLHIRECLSGYSSRNLRE